jgi:hypothetical protein
VQCGGTVNFYSKGSGGTVNVYSKGSGAVNEYTAVLEGGAAI